MTPHDVARPEETHVASGDPASEPVHPHYAAPPPSKEIAGEPRILHALTLAAWVGKLIDPLFHREKDEAATKAEP